MLIYQPYRQVREQGGFIEVLLDVDAKTDFEKKYWKGVLDAQGKVRSPPRPAPLGIRVS